jgi:hypothetical protein
LQFFLTKNYMKNFSLPIKGDYPGHFDHYFEKIPDLPYSKLISSQPLEITKLFSSKSLGWEATAYAEGKWTPKEVLGHLIDTERIMTFRALCIARGEKQNLPGFDENAYVDSADFSKVPLKDLLEDFEAQRRAILSFVKTLSEEVLDTQGRTNDKPITPRALFWIIPGHFIHHVRILNSRY